MGVSEGVDSLFFKDHDEDAYLALLRAHLRAGPMYYSYSFDLTNSMQRQSTADHTLPLWRQVYITEPETLREVGLIEWTFDRPMTVSFGTDMSNRTLLTCEAQHHL